MDDETKERIVYNILKKYAKNNGLVEYRYPDGFYCFGNPDSQEMCNKKHEEWLEKQGEQLIDKIEPKFKVGDWLQYRYAEPFLVEEITEQGYCNGNSCLPFEWEDEIHPWTIQDAKDGDIVYYECHGNKHLFIVKSVGETKDHVEGHFWYDITRNEHEVWDGRLPYSNIASMRDAMPATKEQRDLLFQKMKIVGYEWDSEKKELKKIESKKLDADKVIEWLKAKVYDDSAYGMAMIDKFKKDFGL